MKKYKLVEEIVFYSSKQKINESVLGLIPAYGSEIYFILKNLNLIGKKTQPDEINSIPSDSTIEPKSLMMNSPSVRYGTTPGFQLSRSSTIA